MKTLKFCATLLSIISAATVAMSAQVAGEHYNMADLHRVKAVQDTETPAQHDARMAWWREARFGMFIHWGLYSIPAGTWNGKQVPGIGEWIMNRGTIPVSDYKALASKFNPTGFNAHDIVALAKAAGMKYIVITSKYRDGFAMFDSEADPFNIVGATPFHHDPIARGTVPPYLELRMHKSAVHLLFTFAQVLLFLITIAEHYSLVALHLGRDRRWESCSI